MGQWCIHAIVGGRLVTGQSAINSSSLKNPAQGTPIKSDISQLIVALWP